MTAQLSDRLHTSSIRAGHYDLPRIETNHSIWIAALLSASFAALFNSSAPTGIGPVDGLYRAAFVAGVVWFAPRARRWTWVLLAGVAAVSTATLAGQIVGVVALGAAAGCMGAARRRRAAGALIAAVSTPCLLAQGMGPFDRLTGGFVEDRFATSAVLTALAVWPLLTSAWRRMSTGRQRPIRLAVRRGGYACLVGGGIAVAALLIAAPLISQAMRSSESAVALGVDGYVDQAAVEFGRADDEWRSANRVVSGPWMLPGRLIPILGQHVRAAQVATGQASALADSATAVTSRLDPDELVVAGTVSLDELHSLSPALDALSATTTRAHGRLSDAQSPWLVSFFERRIARSVDRLAPFVSVVGASAEAVNVGLDLLGSADPATIVAMFTTPAEARGAGGFVGTWVEFEAVDGRLELRNQYRSSDLNALLAENRAVLDAGADYTVRYGRFDIERHIQDVTLSPDLPSVAQVASSLYEQATGEDVEALFLVDPFVVAELLEFTGPVETADGYRLTASNAVDELLNNQYTEFDGEEPAREGVLAQVAATMVRRMLAEPPDPIPFARAMAPLAEANRIGLWLADDSDGSIADRLGLSGAFPDPDRGDFLAVVHQNTGQNKIDTLLEREISVNTTLGVDSNAIAHEIRITLRNNAPSTGLPDAVIASNDQGLDLGTNWMTLSVYSPLRLDRALVGGEPAAVDSQVELGFGVTSIQLAIGPGESMTVDLRLSGALSLDEGYDLTMWAQPLSKPDAITWRMARADRRPIEAPDGWTAGEDTLSFERLLSKTERFDFDL